MEKSEIIQKIISKKEFSHLPEKDVELAFSHFEKRQTSDEEKIKLTRELLHKVFGVFASEKLLSPKNKSAEWILKKHISTRERVGILRSSSKIPDTSGERFDSYGEVYGRIFLLTTSHPPTLSTFGAKSSKKISVIDLGCGVNGFSFNFENMKKFGINNYLGVEAIGQLVDLTNNYFAQEKIPGKVIHKSLFELEKIKEVILSTEKPRVVFLFKVLDSLEMVEGDYSKKILKAIVPLADLVIVSFATRSLVARKKFFVNRNWIVDFIKENFSLVEDFETNGERYLIIRNKIN